MLRQFYRNNPQKTARTIQYFSQFLTFLRSFFLSFSLNISRCVANVIQKFMCFGGYISRVFELSFSPSFILFFSSFSHTHTKYLLIMLNLLQNEKLFNSQIYELLFFDFFFIHCENSFDALFPCTQNIFAFHLLSIFQIYFVACISFHYFSLLCFRIFLLKNEQFSLSLWLFALFPDIYFLALAALSFHWQNFLPLNSWTFCLLCHATILFPSLILWPS